MMRKLIIVGCCCFISSFSLAEGNAVTTRSIVNNQEQPSENVKVSVAILPLKALADSSLGDLSDVIYQRVTNSLLMVRVFEPIERSQIATLLQEGQFQNSGITDENSAILLGKQAGARTVIIGSYTGKMEHNVEWITSKDGQQYKSETYPASLSVNLRLVDVQTGKILNSFTVQQSTSGSDSASSLESLLNGFTAELNYSFSSAYPFQGYVIKAMSARDYMIDLGKDKGLAKGDKFTVFTRGEDIVHPVTGRVIKGEKKELGVAEVKTVDDETSIIKISVDLPVPVGAMVESKPTKPQPLGLVSGIIDIFGSLLK